MADAKAFLKGSFPLNLTSNRHLAAIFTTIERFDLGLDYLERFPELIQAVTQSEQAGSIKRQPPQAPSVQLPLINPSEQVGTIPSSPSN